MVESRLIKHFVNILDKASLEEILAFRRIAIDGVEHFRSRENKADAVLSLRLIEEELIARNELDSLKKIQG